MSETQQKAPKETALRAKLRRKGLKFLALCERARVGISKHPVSPLLYAVILALVVGYVTFNGMYTKAYVLTVDGQELGMVASEGDVKAMVANVEHRASDILGEEYSYSGNIELTPALTTTSGIGDTGDMEDTMFANAGALVTAYSITVNGRLMGYAPSATAMQYVLDCIAMPYVNEHTTRYEFVEDVQISTVELPSNTEFDLQGLYDALTVCTVEDAYYTVEKGDTFNNIAYALDMTPADLSALNPDININVLMIGQQLLIQQSVPFLSVRTYTNETYEAVVYSPIEEIPTEKYYVGTTVTKEEGTDGLALVNADITYVNGMEVERTVITSETLEEPTTTYVYVGTTPRPKTASTGKYAWPTSSHKITSDYGWRYIFGEKDWHQGIDIGAGYGSTIKASDGGKVTFAGWKGTYGKLVIVTHDNGDQTYYAHCSTIVVDKGDKVYKGQKIAEIGSTGRSTGPHLHFEIRKDGKTVDPEKYLP